MLHEERLEFLRILRQSIRRFEITVIEGHGIVRKIDEGNLRACGLGTCDGQAHQFLVERILAGAASKGEDARGVANGGRLLARFR